MIHYKNNDDNELAVTAREDIHKKVDSPVKNKAP